MNQDTLSLIIQHGISIRHIPHKLTSTFDIRHYKEGDEIIVIGSRKMCRRYKTPKHPGHWMCRIVNHTDSLVQWSYKNDNLAPTLDESIALLLNKLR